MVYLAKVDNAASAATTGQKWFKVAEAGLSGGKWAVDTMIANKGWHYFTMPSCIAPGDYLMRVELIALHGAQRPAQAQFYMECAQYVTSVSGFSNLSSNTNRLLYSKLTYSLPRIRITGSGAHSGSNFVSFPGAYKSSDPGILVNIYDNSGDPNNGGRPYSIPGPRPITC